jgi:hypothetical protein
MPASIILYSFCTAKSIIATASPLAVGATV